MKNWILVANKNKANFFELDEKMHKLKLISTLKNEYARLKEQDLVSDSPGKVVNSSTGPGPRGLGKENKALNQQLKKYTKKIVEFTKKEKINNTFDNLIIVAGPSFIGDLSDELTRKNVKINQKIQKDLVNFKEEHIYQSIHDQI